MPDARDRRTRTGVRASSSPAARAGAWAASTRAWCTLAGKPMIAHVLARFAPQVDAVVINANQNLDRYAAFGYPVLPDAVGGFAGPLAGLHAGLTHATHALVATVPCDSPFLPDDLVARLAAALEARDAQLAVAKTFDQPHPVFCLVRRDVLPHLAAFLEARRAQDRRVVRDARASSRSRSTTRPTRSATSTPPTSSAAARRRKTRQRRRIRIGGSRNCPIRTA